MIARNRAVYDVLVLLLCYPEKRTSDLEGVISVHVDEDDEASDASSELQESYNVRNGRESLPDLLRSASKTHHAAAPTGQGSERPAVHAAVRHAVQVQLQREVHHSHPCMAVFLLPRRNSRTTS